MKRDRLKPYVYKVEGAVNFAFYDMHNGAFYQFSPDGNVDELRKYLLEEGLIFESEGVIPTKIIKFNLWEVQNNLQIRELQIRLNGKGEDNCWNREKKKGNKQYMQKEILNTLQEKCRYIPIKKIRIEAEEDDDDKIVKILKEFEYKEVELYVENNLNKKQIDHYKEICGNRRIVFLKDGRKKIKELKVEIFNFFYSKYYNPCLGHQVAVDTNGDIKCCLWFDDILGNIASDDLKAMIIRGDFDTFWDTSKIKIESCRDCELRFACDDCRVFALKNGDKLESKPAYCKYDPYIGDKTV